MIGRLGNGCRKSTIGPIDVEPHSVLLTERADLRQRVNRARADRSCRSDNEARHLSRCLIRLDLLAQCLDVHPQFLISRYPTNRCSTKATEVCGFLNPRVSFYRTVQAKLASRIRGNAELAHAISGLCGTRR